MKTRARIAAPVIFSKRQILAAVIIVSVACLMQPGCRRSDPRLDARNWFERSAGLKLPATTAVENAKILTVFGVGDAYYIELVATPELEAMLKEHFQSETKIPEGFMPQEGPKDMPFWKVKDLPSPKWFSKKRPEDGEPEWSCSVAYDAAAGKCFFVGAQCR